MAQREETLGEIVGLVEERPVHLNRAGTELLASTPSGFLDLRLVNHQGREKVLRVPVGEEVLDFFADPGSVELLKGSLAAKG